MKTLKSYSISGLVLIFILINSHYSAAQSFPKIWITREGFNKIQIQNNSGCAISLKTGNGTEVVIPSNGAYYAYFNLDSKEEVRNNAIEVCFDKNSFIMDSTKILYSASVQKNNADKFGLRMDALLVLFERDKNWTGFILSIKLGAVLFGIPTPLLDKFFENLAYLNPVNLNDDELSKAAALAIEATVKEARIEADRNAIYEIAQAKERLGTVRNAVYYVSQFINENEKSRWDLTPYISAGFKLNEFQKVLNQKVFNLINDNDKPAYGLRLTYDWNAYKRGVQNNGVSHFIAADLIQSRSAYSNISDSTLSKKSAYAWDFISISYGTKYQFNFNHNRFKYGNALSFDFGLVSNILTESNFDTLEHKIQSTKSKSSFRGIAPFVNIAYKLRVLSWIDLYASYYSTFLYSKLTYNKENLPSFSEYNLGLNIKLFSNKNYQY